MRVRSTATARWAAAAVAVCLPLAVAGCAPAQPSLTPVVSPTTYMPSGTMPDYMFAAQHLSLGKIPLAGVSDVRIRAMGRHICQQLQSGRSVAQVRDAFTGPGGNPVARASAGQADALISAAVRNLCPHFDTLVPIG